MQVLAGGETSPAVEETINFSLHAEIYKVVAEVQQPEGSDVTLEWGLVRGVDQAVKQIVLLNKGRFPVTWQSGWKKQVIIVGWHCCATRGQCTGFTLHNDIASQSSDCW